MMDDHRVVVMWMPMVMTMDDHRVGLRRRGIWERETQSHQSGKRNDNFTHVASFEICPGVIIRQFQESSGCLLLFTKKSLGDEHFQIVGIGAFLEGLPLSLAQRPI